MHRTGIAPELAPPLYRLLATLPGVTPGGLHAYDGHLRDPDLPVRRAQADAAFAQVRGLRDALQAEGLPVPRVVVGGTPTLPCHATRDEPDLELSPGTVVFWDAGYTAGLPDMDFLHAALVLTRVVSKPGGDRVCLDLGHKAVASEMPHPRVVLIGLRLGLQAPRTARLSCRRPSSGTARNTSCSRRQTRRRCTSATCSTASRGTSAPPSPCTARPWSSATAARWTAGTSPRASG